MHHSACMYTRMRLLSAFSPILQLVGPDVAGYNDLADVNKTLKSLNIGHGSIVCFRYTVEREISKNPVQAETKAFGAGRRATKRSDNVC